MAVAVATFENIRLKINSLRNFCTHTSRILSELFLCLQKVGDVANWYKRLITLHIFLKTLYEYDFDLETIIHISCLIKDWDQAKFIYIKAENKVKNTILNPLAKGFLNLWMTCIIWITKLTIFLGAVHFPVTIKKMRSLCMACKLHFIFILGYENAFQHNIGSLESSFIMVRSTVIVLRF